MAWKVYQELSIHKLDYSSEPTTLVTFTLEATAKGTAYGRRVGASTVSRCIAATLRLRSGQAEAFRMNDSGWAEQLVNIERHVTAPR